MHTNVMHVKEAQTSCKQQRKGKDVMNVNCLVKNLNVTACDKLLIYQKSFVIIEKFYLLRINNSYIFHASYVYILMIYFHINCFTKIV